METNFPIAKIQIMDKIKSREMQQDSSTTPSSSNSISNDSNNNNNNAKDNNVLFSFLADSSLSAVSLHPPIQTILGTNHLNSFLIHPSYRILTTWEDSLETRNLLRATLLHLQIIQTVIIPPVKTLNLLQSKFKVIKLYR